MKLPRDIGPIHFVGIGGIGMSGIAEVLVNLGYTVQGSDVAESANVKRLRDKGIASRSATPATISSGADVVVVSSAIKRDNPELVAARAQAPAGGAPRRNAGRADAAEELRRHRRHPRQDHHDLDGRGAARRRRASIRRSSTAASSTPTAPTRGSAPATGWWSRPTNRDGTFLKLPADIAIVTNVDPEHLDHFKTFDAVQDAFRAFVENVPFYGFAVMCIDHPVVQTLVGRIEDRRIITYGENPQADVRADRRRAMPTAARSSPSLFRDRAGSDAHEIDNLALPMPGRHNALNATAAIAVAHELGIADDLIRKALARLRRRAAPLHPHRRVERHHRHRRLRPPSGGDRRRAEGRARIGRRAR